MKLVFSGVGDMRHVERVEHPIGAVERDSAKEPVQGPHERRVRQRHQPEGHGGEDHVISYPAARGAHWLLLQILGLEQGVCQRPRMRCLDHRSTHLGEVGRYFCASCEVAFVLSEAQNLRRG